jgi:hypothetical protein
MSAFLGVIGLIIGAAITIGGMVAAVNPLVFLGLLVIAGTVTVASAVSYHPPRRLASAPAAASHGCTNVVLCAATGSCMPQTRVFAGQMEMAGNVMLRGQSVSR